MNGTPNSPRTLTNVLLASIALLLLLNLWAIQSRPQAQTLGSSQEAQREIAQATLEVARANQRIATALETVAEAIKSVKLEIPESNTPVASAPAAGGATSPAAAVGGSYEGTFQLGN